MRVHLSDEALNEFERLETYEPDRFEVLVADLAMLEALGPEGLKQWAVIGTLRYCLGPTGRVRYWLGREDNRFVVEYFDLD